MKRLLILSLCALGFILTTAPTAVEYHQLLVNGKPFGNVALINGKLAFPLIDFCKLGGGAVTLEEVGLTLNGNTLRVSAEAVDAFHKHKDLAGKVKVEAASTVAPTYKESPAAVKIDFANAKWRRQNDGVITNNAIRFGGGVWIPLSDLARAFGGTFTDSANLKPGDAVRLNFTKTPNAVLVGL